MNRRDFQFRLRSLLVSVAICALAWSLASPRQSLAEEPTTAKKVTVWRYRMVNGAADAPRDFGRIYVEPKSGEFVYQYWRGMPWSWDRSLPEKDLLGKPTGERPLQSAYGFDGKQRWLSLFFGYGTYVKNLGEGPLVNSWHALEQVTDIGLPAKKRSDLAHSYAKGWLDGTPVQCFFWQIGCESWTNADLLSAFRKSPDVKPLADTAETQKLFKKLTKTKLTPEAVIYEHEPGADAAKRSASSFWGHVIVVDKSDSSLAYCKVWERESGHSGPWDYPFPIGGFEIVRDGKQEMNPQIFTPEAYSDEHTWTMQPNDDGPKPVKR
jgi:hypothetical protein